MNFKFIFILPFLSVFYVAGIFAQTGYSYTFESNTEGWWNSGGNPTHTVSQEDGALKVVVDKTSDSWDFIGANNFGTLDLSENPYVSFDIIAGADIEQLFVVFVDENNKNNRDQFFWGEPKMYKSITAGDTYKTLTYDFSTARDAAGNIIDYSAVNQVWIFFNMGGVAYSGEVSIDNFKIGSEVVSDDNNTGFSYIWKSNTEGWWNSAGNPTHLVSQEDGALKVVVDKTSDSWDFIGANNFGTLDLSLHPFVSFDIKTNTEIEKLFVVFIDENKNSNRDQFFWGEPKIFKSITAGDTYQTLTYDFSTARDAEGNKIDYSAVTQVWLFFNMGGVAYSGEVFIDDFKIGSEAVSGSTPPAGPKNLSASNITQSGCFLTWEKPHSNSGLSGFTIFKNDEFLKTVQDTSAVISGLECGQSYDFFVQAFYDDSTTSDPGNTVTVKASPCINNDDKPDLVFAKPVTDRIIMLYFDEGYVDFHSLGETAWNHDVPHQAPLDIAKAINSETYNIVSPDDDDYSNPRQPVKTGRKSKGGDFTPKGGATIIMDHYIYLELPAPMKNGNEYIINTSDLAGNTDNISITFNPSETQSASIHVNQVGYSTKSGIKTGYVYHWMGDMGPLDLDEYDNTPFHLVDIQSGDIVFSGSMTLRKDLETGEPDTYNTNDSYNYCMADVWECDFSSFNTSGEYRLVVEKIGCSYPFLIGEDAYREAFITTTRGLYHHRSGIKRDLPYSEWFKDVDHKPGVNGFSIEYSTWRYMDGGNAFTQLPENATGEIFPDNPGDWMPKNQDDWGWGGYFDAGDWDRHTGHLQAAYHLLTAFELAPENFVDNELNIPEKGNGIPDIIDEAKWVVDAYRRLQGPTGGICGGMEQDEHPKPGENSVTDSRPWFVYAEDPQASFRLAAANAQLAYCLNMAGSHKETDSLISQAERVYQWAQENLLEHDEEKILDDRMRASAWLFRYTGKKIYHEQFKSDYNSGAQDQFAVYTYVLNKIPTIDKTLQQEIKNTIIEQATELLEAGKQRSDRWASIGLYGWHGTGKATTPYVWPLIFAYEIEQDNEYLDYAYTSCDYFLGGNPLNMTYVTGLGEHSPQQILNVDSWFDGKEEVIPGIVPYGYHTYGPWMDEGKNNVYQVITTYESCYPDWHDWPTHEMWFEDRYAILSNEYTIQQTIGPAAGIYAYLSGKKHDEGVKMNSIDLHTDSIQLFKGYSTILHAAVSPYNSSEKSIVWSSSDTSVVSVRNGFIEAKKTGEAFIIASNNDNSISDTIIIIVTQPVKVESVNIKEEEIEIKEGEKRTIVANIVPENAQNKLLKWESSDTLLATIDNSGIVLGLQKGTCYAIAISDDGGLKDSVKITIIEAEQSPYGSMPFEIPGRIEAENYDIGGNYISYFDKDLENMGTTQQTPVDIRTDEGVDIQFTQDEEGLYNVGWVQNNEWVEYSVNVKKEGEYDFFVRAASQTEGGNIFIFSDNILLDSILISSTGAWQTWETFSKKLQLQAGEQILRFLFSGNDVSLFNVNWFEFESQDQNTSVERNNNVNLATVSLFPNPSNGDYITVKINGLKKSYMFDVVIHDIKGNIVSKSRQHGELFTLNIKDIDNGMYYVTVMNEHTIGSGMFVKL